MFYWIFRHLVIYLEKKGIKAKKKTFPFSLSLPPHLPLIMKTNWGCFQLTTLMRCIPYPYSTTTSDACSCWKYEPCYREMPAHEQTCAFRPYFPLLTFNWRRVQHSLVPCAAEVYLQLVLSAHRGFSTDKLNSTFFTQYFNEKPQSQ